MQNGSINKLTGTVESDETVIGGTGNRFKHRSKQNRSYESKVLVMGMLERGGEVRATVIPNPQVRTIQREIKKHVEAGSELMTDAYVAYTNLTP